MTFISAIELESFQSIGQRTRFELRPITLLFGPNSAGKSALFDALELLQILLDPTCFDESLAAEMVNRWARRVNEAQAARQMFLAIEFPFCFEESGKVWCNDSNWTSGLHRTEAPSFYIGGEDVVAEYELEKATIRMELWLKAIEGGSTGQFRLSEFSCSLKQKPLVSLTLPPTTDLTSNQKQREIDEREDWNRTLTVFNHFEFVNYALLAELKSMKERGTWNLFVEEPGEIEKVLAEVSSPSLSPLKLIPNSTFTSWIRKELTTKVARNAHDIVFYFGTLLFQSLRNAPGIVKSDRRTPKPHEALAVVDLGLNGWWSRTSFSPSSPATLLMAQTKDHDEHFHGLAEIAHADLILQLTKNEERLEIGAAKHLEKVNERAKLLTTINRHLERNLFFENGYKLACASTLLVPIDLRKKDPWEYYSIAQPAAVRLFLRDRANRSVEFEDVGSGIPFVLPILYVLAVQTLVRIQQPELHLHPALQSSIADVFIEEMNHCGSKQFIIETHSEHLLLRFLRRVRDLEKGKRVETKYKIGNNEIAIYYFNPAEEQGTVVTQIEITPYGDFLQDWPRGFFEERNEDLFDDE